MCFQSLTCLMFVVAICGVGKSVMLMSSRCFVSKCQMRVWMLVAEIRSYFMILDFLRLLMLLGPFEVSEMSQGHSLSIGNAPMAGWQHNNCELATIPFPCPIISTLTCMYIYIYIIYIYIYITQSGWADLCGVLHVLLLCVFNSVLSNYCNV